MNALEDVLSRVRITELAQALGIKLDKTRRRGVATWREGRNFSVSFNDVKNVWHDFVTGSGGGILDLVQRVRGGSRADALRWLADFAGVVIDDRPESRADRRAFAERRERDERDMREAEFFRIAAERVAEHVLEELPEAVEERFRPTQFLLNLRGSQGAALLALYRNFRASEPRLTAALVFAGERTWERLSLRLARYIAANTEVPLES
jgi:hypothetical protein